MSVANCELDDNDSSDGQFGTDFADASVSWKEDSSHKIIDERNVEEVHQLRNEFNENDSYDWEAKQTLRVDGTIFDQIGLDFALKVLNMDSNTTVRLQLWDIAGEERFGTMPRVYYKDAVGAFIVFDLTRKQSFDQIIKWKSDLDAKVCLPDGNPLPSVLLANKCDLQDAAVANVVNAASLDQFCEQQKFEGWFYTSAKDNVNVDESANFLIGKVLEKHTTFLDSWRMEFDALSLENNDDYNPQHRLNYNTCSC